MFFSCRILFNNDWLIQGRQVNYNFYFVILLLLIPFSSFPRTHWSFWFGITMLIILYKTSWFSIYLGQQQLKIQRKILGITYSSYTFQFNNCSYSHPPRKFKFSTNKDTFSLSYEELDFDEFSYTINSKFGSLGSINNSDQIYHALKEWKKVYHN